MAPKFFALRSARERRHNVVLRHLKPRFSEMSDDQLEKVLRHPWEEGCARREYIYRHGLPVKLQLKLLDGFLWALVVQPQPGYLHLVRDICVPEAIKRYGVYHVSLASVDSVDADLLAQAKRLWDGWSGRLVAARISETTGYILVGGELGRCVVLNAIFRRGNYGYKEGLHISG